MKIMRECTDGFVIAQKDLQLRGPGEVLGTRQTGLAHMKIADLLRDASLVKQTYSLAKQLIRDYPDCVTPIIQRWVAQRQEYGKV